MWTYMWWLSAGSHVYNLQAVLIHSGHSAYSGHYTAHLQAQGQWHTFNDEIIQDMGLGKKLKLGEEDSDTSKCFSINVFIIWQCLNLATYIDTQLQDSYVPTIYYQKYLLMHKVLYIR